MTEDERVAQFVAEHEARARQARRDEQRLAGDPARVAAIRAAWAPLRRLPAPDPPDEDDLPHRVVL